MRKLLPWNSGFTRIWVFSRASRTLRGATQGVTFLSVRDQKKYVAGPTDPPQFTHRVKVQTKTDQKFNVMGV